MTNNILPFTSEPYGSWDEGILSLCDSLTDRHRFSAALLRMERTAKRLPPSVEDLCILALVSPLQALAKPINPEATKRPRAGQEKQRPEVAEAVSQALARINAWVSRTDAREQQAAAAFDPGDPRHILSGTIWGIVAAAMVDVSDRLDTADPFRRLGSRLRLWFHASSARRWLGVAQGVDCHLIWDLLRDLVARLPQPTDDNAAAAKLLRITTQLELLPHSPEGLDVLFELGEEIEGKAARVLLESLILATMEHIDWDNSAMLQQADCRLYISVMNRTYENEDVSFGPTASLAEWLKRDKRSVFLPDLSWFMQEICCHLHEWPDGKPEVVNALADLTVREGFGVFSQGPFPLAHYGVDGNNLTTRLFQSLPEAHDLLRLLSLNDGDWSEGGEAGPDFWGAPRNSEYTVVNLLTACERALERGDPALADMLLGCWLVFLLLGTRRVLPDVAGVARLIRRLPTEDRASVNAVLRLINADLTNDAESSQRLSSLLSYLPPVGEFAPSQPEADLRAHLGDEEWNSLRPQDQRVLLENERLFRDLRAVGETGANDRGPAKLLPHWAAVFEPLLRSALRRCSLEITKKIKDKTTLGQLLPRLEQVLKDAGGWALDDPRRQYVIEEQWIRMLQELDKANLAWGKHLDREESPQPSWYDVAALRSRVIFGGALRRCLQAAGRSAFP